MKKSAVTFITRHEHTLRAFLNQCDDLGVSETLNIEGRTLSQLAYLPFNGDSLIIPSSNVILPALQPYLPPDANIIVAKRIINYANIRNVLEIPRGMKVLVVNDTGQRTEETIALLKESGINLEFYPFYPNGPAYPHEITIAVTPGESQHVPSAIPKVIDIGSRVIHLSTWIEIYDYFRLEIAELCKMTSRYVYSIVYSTRELSDEIQKVNLLRNHLRAIVDRIEDGVLAMDETGIVRITNQKALETLHLQGRNITNQEAASVMQAHFYQIICQLPYEKEEVINWDNQPFFFRKTHIMIEGINYGYLILFRPASEINKLEHDYRRKQTNKGLFAKYTFHDLTGVSNSFKKVADISRRMARSNTTILLLGETGTGKELLAQAIHNASPRKWEPFVGVNFAAISESLLESELFGYEEGAFTGAKKGGHIGLFEQAHKGTIFLDEIGDASQVIQNRLLRVLQEREIMRVGGNRVIPIDIRVIAATNRDLEKLVQEGLFRADLYYRLNVLPIFVPPLRERKEDIPLLVQEFIKKVCNDLKRPLFRISQEAMQAMLQYDWPGNIRELENVTQYLAHVTEEVVLPSHLLINKREETAQQVISVEEEELETIYQFYKGKDFLLEMKMILEIMQNAQNAVGRNFIVSHMKMSGRTMTQQQLRYRMQLLKQNGLLNAGRGRQGSALTEKGIKFLQYIKVCTTRQRAR